MRTTVSEPLAQSRNDHQGQAENPDIRIGHQANIKRLDILLKVKWSERSGF